MDIDGAKLDLRQIPVVIAAIYGGTFPSLATAVIIAIGRTLLFPFETSTIRHNYHHIYRHRMCAFV
jgi:hypothetical protein